MAVLTRVISTASFGIYNMVILFQPKIGCNGGNKYPFFVIILWFTEKDAFYETQDYEKDRILIFTHSFAKDKTPS